MSTGTTGGRRGWTRGWTALAWVALGACVSRPEPTASRATVTRGDAPVAPRASAAPVASVAPASSVAPGSEGHVAPAVPAARTPTLLILGDSHTYGPFGARLHALLAARGRYAITSEGAGGASTETYLEAQPLAAAGYRVRETTLTDAHPRTTVDVLRGPIHHLDELLAQHDPDVIVVALGTNHPQTNITKSAARLLARLVRDRPRRIVWVGPPAFGGTTGSFRARAIERALEEVPGAVLIDSTRFNQTHPLALGNPHFGPDEAKRWAGFVAAKIAVALDGREPTGQPADAK